MKVFFMVLFVVLIVSGNGFCKNVVEFVDSDTGETSITGTSDPIELGYYKLKSDESISANIIITGCTTCSGNIQGGVLKETEDISSIVWVNLSSGDFTDTGSFYLIAPYTHIRLNGTGTFSGRILQ